MSRERSRYGIPSGDRFLQSTTRFPLPKKSTAAIPTFAGRNSEIDGVGGVCIAPTNPLFSAGLAPSTGVRVTPSTRSDLDCSGSHVPLLTRYVPHDTPPAVPGIKLTPILLFVGRVHLYSPWRPKCQSSGCSERGVTPKKARAQPKKSGVVDRHVTTQKLLDRARGVGPPVSEEEPLIRSEVKSQ
jgi:hypothetical protein